MNAQVGTQGGTHFAPREAAPVSVGDWILTLIVLAIPLVGIVMLFVWGFSSGTNPSKQNYCRAALILAAILLVLWVLFVVTFGAALLHAAHSMGGASL
ncbi:MAG TPA: hypothetical protein VJ862_06630 [Rhodanobacteraceae bacterium]|nr:hypothetical protein [Rhodanobacteraceae bacterium]